MDFAKEEIERISVTAQNSWYERPTGLATIRHSFSIFRRFMNSGEKILEMGPAEGIMTAELLGAGLDVELLEGSPEFARLLRNKFPDTPLHVALFEIWDSDPAYDIILLGHVLEHVDSPRQILARAAKWLNPGGRFICAVPNCRSLHRQVAVIMGLLQTEQDMSDKDIHHSHRRIYSPESLRSEFTLAGLKIDFFGGYWLKPISDAQIEAHWSPEMLDAFMVLGERYPDIAAEMVIVASPR